MAIVIFLLLIVCAVLLAVAVAKLNRMERHLGELTRIQTVNTPPDLMRRLRNDVHEEELFERFIQEDFTRNEMPGKEQRAEFQKWKLANG